VVLSLLAAGLSYSMRVEMRLAQNSEAEADLRWLARSGVELACWYLAEKNRDPSQARFDALNQLWAGGPAGTNEPLTGLSLELTEFGRGRFSVSIIDLERRFNINRAPREVLQRAMELLGYDTLESARVIDSIEDWRDPDDLRRLHGAESDHYQDLGYVAKNGPIDDLSELLLVQGVTPAIFWGSGRTNWIQRVEATAAAAEAGAAHGSMGLVDLFNTVGGPQININTASPEVLMLLPGMDEGLAAAVVRVRAGMDGVDGTEDDTPFQNVGELINVGGMPPQYIQALRALCNVVSASFEVRVRVQVEQYERTHVAIIRRPVTGLPGGGQRGGNVQILAAYWE
jgi:type II secretory pathway component PulK